jgi:hypothetical protein
MRFRFRVSGAFRQPDDGSLLASTVETTELLAGFGERTAAVRVGLERLTGPQRFTAAVNAR